MYLAVVSFDIVYNAALDILLSIIPHASLLVIHSLLLLLLLLFYFGFFCFCFCFFCYTYTSRRLITYTTKKIGCGNIVIYMSSYSLSLSGGDGVLRGCVRV